MTGGTGYIGSHTVVELQQAGYQVVIIDNPSNSSADVVEGIERITGIKPDFVEGDCTDMATLTRLLPTIPTSRALLTLQHPRLWVRAWKSPSSITATTSTLCSIFLTSWDPTE